MRVILLAVVAFGLLGCRTPMTHTYASERVEFVQGEGFSEKPCGYVRPVGHYDINGHSGEAWEARYYHSLPLREGAQNVFSSREEAVGWITTNWCKP